MVAAAAVALAGCGSGSTSSFASPGSSTTSSNPTQAQAASVTVITSQPQIPSNNSQSATITALVRDTNNVLLQGVNVAFTTNSGAIVVSQATTDANGEATATLSTPGDYANRTITVSASVAQAKGSVAVQVVGTTLSLNGPSSLIENGQAGTYTVALLDSGGNGIAGQSVTIASANGNKLASTNLTTDATGHATFTATGTVAGSDTLTATAAGLTAQQAVSVSSQTFQITVPAANVLIPLNTPTTVTANWMNNGAPQTGQSVSFAATRGSFVGSSSATTDSNGNATVTVESSTAGPATITASASGVTAQLPVDFVATTPASITVQANPSTIPTSGQSTITAVVRDANDNLVQGQQVDFQLTDVTGGTISQATATTDAQGIAQTVYAASSTASAANGVTVTATVQGTSISGSVNLTVGGQTVFLSLGTGSTISENSNKTQFIMPFSVQALDSAGNAISGVPITLTVHSAQQPYWAYAKGGWYVVGSAWEQTGTPGPPATAAPITTCLNEDVNGNGILDPGEDYNGNGKLDPGDVAAVSPGSVTTDSTGTAVFNVVYPEDHAEWVQVTLTASTTVNGTQSSTNTTFVLPILASYVNNTSSTPPGYVSPYGIATSCSNPN